MESIEKAIRYMKNGRMIIIVDDEDRENEGDLVFAAQFADKQKVNFMAREGRGLICVPMLEQDLERLGIPMMVDNNTSPFSTGFTVSVEASEGVTTGISAADRAKTIKVLSDPGSCPADLVRPGHIFPLRAKKGGVLVRAGQTEASVDMCRLSGLFPAAVICEIMKDNGDMARLPDLEVFSDKHDIPIISVEDIIKYRSARETLVKKIDEATLPTLFGNFRMTGFEVQFSGEHHIALSMGQLNTDEPVLVRVHSECLTGDALFSRRCDCGSQLEHAMEKISSQGRGVLLYMRQEGRGIGLLNKIRAYRLQDEGQDTVEANHSLGFKADLRDYGVGAQILRFLGADRIRLMTNNPKKIVGLRGHGIKIVETLPVIAGHCEHNKKYLDTKKQKMGHLI